ncbi:MAG: helix-turn-helix domain-containing protein, partial [Chloroflexota bacterium]|nr:helix-turn-helix domain-containing protein [Chloroflexota bacterium]
MRKTAGTGQRAVSGRTLLLARKDPAIRDQGLTAAHATETDSGDTFGALLRAHRLAANLTQATLAERAAVSTRGIQDLERGLRRPHRQTLLRLMAALGLSADEQASLRAVATPTPRRGATELQRKLEWISRARLSDRHNLPLQLSSFVGREDELAELQRVSRIARLLTLTGAGGIGKTRLAMEAARAMASAYPDGVWLVELAHLVDPGLVPEAVATAVGVLGTPGQDMSTTLALALQRRSLLLLLDNCEHLVASCAALADGLQRACPELRILATGREPLGVAGELVWTVQPLAVPDPADAPSVDVLSDIAAVRLFVERAQAGQPGFVLHEANGALVADICRHLEGVPLALELAAARVRTLGVTELASRLDDRLHLLVGGSRVAPARQQTLRATLDWSYALLSEPERTLFARLAVFAGGWTLEASEAVCAGDGLAREAVLDVLAQLVDRSLVAVDPTPGGGVRYRLLETVREYAHERLVESAEVAGLQRRHATWYHQLAERADRLLLGPDQMAWMARLETELGNLRAALDWSASLAGDPELGLRTAAALWWFWPRSGHLHEGRAYLNRLLALHTKPTSVRAWGLQAAAQAAYLAGDLVTAQVQARAALSIAKAPPDARTILWAHTGLGALAMVDGDSSGAEEILRQGLSYGEQAADPTGVDVLLWTLGEVKRGQGDLMVARRLLEETLARSEAHGHHDGVCYALASLGHLALVSGDFSRAVSLQLECLALRQTVDLLNIP